MAESMIEWLYMDEDEPDHDLVGKVFGVHVDVVQYGQDTDVWMVYFDNDLLKDNIHGRDNAREWIENRFTKTSEKQKMLADLLQKELHHG